MRITSLSQKFWFRAKLSHLCTMGLPWMAASLTGATALTAIVLSVPAQAAILSRWEYNPSNYELEILVPGGTTPRYSLVAEPARIIVDLPNTTIGTVSQQQTYGGAIREIRVAQHEPGVTRIVLELAPGTVLAPGHVELRQVGTSGSGETNDRWVLRPLLVTDSPAQTATAPTPTTSQPNQSASPSDRQPPAPTTADSSPDSLPPLEPGALEIPVELPPADPIAQSQPALPSIEPGIEPNTESINQPETETEAANPPDNSPSEADRTYGATNQTTEEMPDEVVTVPEPAATVETAETAEPSEPEVSSEPEAVEESSANVVALPDLAIEAVLPDESNLDAVPGAESPVAPTPEVAEPLTAITPPEVSEPSNSSEQPEIQPVPQPNPPSQPIVQPGEGLPALPPADPSTSAPAMVNVPSLEEEVATEEPPNEAPLAATSPTPETPTAPPAAESAPNLDRPSLQAPPSNAPASPSIATAPSPTINRLIEFGQPLTAANPAPSVSAASPLPPASPLQPNATIVPGNVLLPSGTVLSLRYPGTVPLELVEGRSRQEVMVLAASVQDTAGNVILPEGSYVIGRFETQTGRSQFVTQAIALQGRNVLLNAESDNLLGESTSSTRPLQNSAIGGTAETVSGGVPGVGSDPAIAAGGASAATTAATTDVSAVSFTVIQPNQVFEVQLTEDLPRVN